MTKFNELFKLNVNDKTEKKDGLTYLSWSYAWSEFKKVYPDATYQVIKDANFNPYFESSAGVMVYTEVTADNLTYQMWLPVMNSRNKTMKSSVYSYKLRDGKELFVEPFTMTDINKTIMRCLVKNLAMFGLGLYIYSGEDLPEAPEKEPADFNLIKKVINDSLSIEELKANYAACVEELKNSSNGESLFKPLIAETNKKKIELSPPVVNLEAVSNDK